jgi:hypothetical protein
MCLLHITRMRLLVRAGFAPRLKRFRTVSGGYSGDVTPDPISNSEVKLASADGTARETLWESRTPPDFSWNPSTKVEGFVFFVGCFSCASKHRRNSARMRARGGESAPPAPSALLTAAMADQAMPSSSINRIASSNKNVVGWSMLMLGGPSP